MEKSLPITLGLCLALLCFNVNADQLMFSCKSDIAKGEYREKFSDPPADYDHPKCSTNADSSVAFYSIFLDTEELYAEVEYVSCTKMYFSAHQKYSVKAHEVKKEPFEYVLKVLNPVSNNFWYHQLSRSKPVKYTDINHSYSCEVEKIETKEPDF